MFSTFGHNKCNVKRWLDVCKIEKKEEQETNNKKTNKKTGVLTEACRYISQILSGKIIIVYII